MADVRKASPTWRGRVQELEEFIAQGWTNKRIGIHYGASERTVRNNLSLLYKEGLMERRPSDWLPASPTQPEVDPDDIDALADQEIAKRGHRVDKDNVTGTHKSELLLKIYADGQLKDDDYLLRQHGYDPELWDVKSSTSKVWNVYSKQDYVITLYSSAITVVKRANGRSDEQWMEFFVQLARDFKSPVHVPTRYSTDGKMLEIDIADLHLAKLSWEGDSGDIYNHEIARERFFYIINDAITKTQNYTFECVLFIWSNDFFHIDGPGKTTTKGTPQDASMQFEDMFEYGAQMLVEGMDLATQIAPTTTLYVASNHDRLTSFFATKYLQAWFRNNKFVTVDSRPLSRKAVRFGRNLTGFTHGHLEQKRMGTWLSVDYAEDWGQTVFHEVHAHHIHSLKQIVEENGQVTRFMSSPTGTDRWHHDSAWTGAIQRAQSFIYDREMGIENVLYSTIPIDRAARKALPIGDVLSHSD